MMIRSEDKDAIVNTNSISAFDCYGAVCVTEGGRRVLMAAPNMCRQSRNIEGITPLDLILIAIGEYSNAGDIRVLEMSKLLRFWDAECKGVQKSEFQKKFPKLPDWLFTVYGKENNEEENAVKEDSDNI